MMRRLLSHMQPYQIFFSLGLLYGMAGVLLWPLFFYKLIGYPIIIHRHLMLLGFMLQVMVGFLLTSVPRMTQTRPIVFLELSVAIILGLLPIVVLIKTAWLDWMSPLTAVLLFSFLLYFFISRRFFLRSKNQSHEQLPDFYDLIGYGLLFGLMGACVVLFYTLRLWSVSESWHQVGESLLYQSVIYTVTLGVGASLVTSILGLKKQHDLVHISRKIKKNAQHQKSALVTCLILLSFLSPILMNKNQTWLLFYVPELIRAILFTFFAVFKWQIYRVPKSAHYLSLGLFVSIWSILLGLWWMVFFKSSFMHGLHTQFISGFGLMSFLIAARMSVAHGGYPLDVENKSWVILGFIFLCVLSLLVRIYALFFPIQTFKIYADSAWFFLLSCVLWCLYYMPRMVRRL